MLPPRFTCPFLHCPHGSVSPDFLKLPAVSSSARATYATMPVVPPGKTGLPRLALSLFPPGEFLRDPVIPS